MFLEFIVNEYLSPAGLNYNPRYAQIYVAVCLGPIAKARAVKWKWIARTYGRLGTPIRRHRRPHTSAITTRKSAAFRQVTPRAPTQPQNYFTIIKRIDQYQSTPTMRILIIKQLMNQAQMIIWPSYKLISQSRFDNSFYQGPP